LAAAGIGHWVASAPLNRADVGVARDAVGPLVAGVQRRLADYGYGVEVTGGFDAQTEYVVRAFQRHFRPERVDGRIDQSTIATLERLCAARPARTPSA
jgi:N-acetylmuramoyl-L-alanine amidase